MQAFDYSIKRKKKRAQHVRPKKKILQGKKLQPPPQISIKYQLYDLSDTLIKTGTKRLDSHISQSKTNTNIKNRAKINTQRSHYKTFVTRDSYSLFHYILLKSAIPSAGWTHKDQDTRGYCFIFKVRPILSTFSSIKRFERKPESSNNILSY